MFLEQWIHQVENKVFALGRGWWQGPPKTDLELQIQPLEEEHQTNEIAHKELEQQAELLRMQLATWKDQIDQLVRKVGTLVREKNEATAWPMVLELEDLRRQQSEAQPRLPKVEQAAWSLQFRNRQIERQLDELRKELSRRKEAEKPKPRRRPKR